MPRSRSPWWLACIAALGFVGLDVGGCTRPLPLDDAGRDASALDAAVDAAVADTALLDAPAADVRPADAPRSDTPLTDVPGDAGVLDAPVDAGVLDAPVDAGSECQRLFGALPDYVSCAETATSCEFAVTLTDLNNCREVCETVPSGDCFEAFRNVGLSCSRGARTGCGGDATTAICVCRF